MLFSDRHQAVAEEAVRLHSRSKRSRFTIPCRHEVPFNKLLVSIAAGVTSATARRTEQESKDPHGACISLLVRGHGLEHSFSISSVAFPSSQRIQQVHEEVTLVTHHAVMNAVFSCHRVGTQYRIPPSPWRGQRQLLRASSISSARGGKHLQTSAVKASGKVHPAVRTSVSLIPSIVTRRKRHECFTNLWRLRLFNANTCYNDDITRQRSFARLLLNFPELQSTNAMRRLSRCGINARRVHHWQPPRKADATVR